MRILLCSQDLGTCEPVATPKIAFPLGLSLIASMLNDEHEIAIFDSNVVKNTLQELRKTIERVNPDIVAISLRNIDGQLSFNACSYYEPFVAMTKIIKEVSPSSKIIIGGPGFTVFPEEIMKRNPEIDFGVVSNGENTIVELLRDLENPGSIKNVVFRDNAKIQFTGHGVPPDLDSVPFPFWEGFDMSAYRKFPYSIGVETKRGCTYNCVHCLYGCLQKKQVLLRSPKRVVNEIEKLVNDYGINHFFFTDPIFNFPPDHGQKICQEIVKRKLDINWRAWFRSDSMNAKVMADALDSGCDLFDFSPDGACNEAMEVLGKNMTINDVERTVNTIGKMENVKVGYNFMYDLPRANMKQMLGLTRLLPKIVRTCKNKLQYMSFSRLRIYPYTPLYDIALKDGKINEQTDLIKPIYYKSNFSKIQHYYVSFISQLFKAKP